MPSPRLPSSLPDPLSFRLRDGTAITARALVPEDRPLVADAFERLSERSRYMRFLTPMPRLPQRTLDALMEVDHHGHVALIALHHGSCVGVVRYVRDRGDPTLADLAITVIDAYQGRGLGRALLLALGDVAVARGVRAFLLDIHPENAGMARLARPLGARLISSEGITRGVLPIRSDTGVAAGLRYAA